jgi:hypothetical protein
VLFCEIASQSVDKPTLRNLWIDLQIVYMGKTITFVATEELADWLEREADRRMTTISSTAQQLLAEKYRSEVAEEADKSHDDSEKTPVPTRSDAEQRNQVSIADVFTESPEEIESVEVKGETAVDRSLPSIFHEYSEIWYRPNTSEDHKFAIRIPEDGPVSANRRYYKTVGGAKKMLERIKQSQAEQAEE